MLQHFSKTVMLETSMRDARKSVFGRTGDTLRHIVKESSFIGMIKQTLNRAVKRLFGFCMSECLRNVISDCV